MVATTAPAQAALAVLTLKPTEGSISTARLTHRTAVHLCIPSLSANLGAAWQPWSTWRPWDRSGESPLQPAGLGHQHWGTEDPPQPPQWEQANTRFVFNVFLLQNVERSLEALGIKVRSAWLLGWGLFLPCGSRSGDMGGSGKPEQPGMGWQGHGVLPQLGCTDPLTDGSSLPPRFHP